jgi:shikimate dehydrogenase
MIRAAVLGADVSKSRSPAIHQAAFKALGLEGEYVAISVDGRGFKATVRQLAEQGYRYLNVTIPHKRAAAALADASSPLVRATRAANTLILRGEKRVRGENTDGYGLLTALGDLGVKVKAGQIHVLVGSGGAAAGGLAALLAAGATVRVVARRTAPARALSRGLSARQRARVKVLPWTPAGLATALEGAEALISAVPAAAWQDEEAQAGLRGLHRRAAVLEMAYGSATPLAKAARDHVARYQDGLPMLVHQAARAVELALGKKPPAGPLLKAARG